MPAVTMKMLREDLQRVNNLLATRGHVLVPEYFLDVDRRYRNVLKDCEETTALINAISLQIGEDMNAGINCDAKKSQVILLKKELAGKEAVLADLKEAIDGVLVRLPNLPEDGIPVGADETANVVIHQRGTPECREVCHWDMLPVKEALEFGTKITGTRFSALVGDIARLHRGIANFMLDQHSHRGYREVIPPVIVNKQSLVGTGQLPKFEEDLFKIDENRYLIPTAEVSLVNLYANTIFKEDVTHTLVALTDCFRAEAGAAGRDTRGLIRQHQFQKVELVTICAEHNTEFEYEYMIESAENILNKLELPYRRMLLCTGDMGFGAQRTYDLEVWMPGQNTYREISSISNCGDFQARRMNIKYKIDGKMQYANTLNGSGLAVGRTLAAILENFYEEGKVWIPSELVPYVRCHYINVGVE